MDKESTFLNFSELAMRGTQISSEEAIEDISPVDWSDDVLAGDYVGQNLVKGFDNNGIEDIKNGFMYQQDLLQIARIKFPEIVTRGTKISSEEALSDVTPVEWSQDVLAGKYKGKVLIKATPSDK